MHLLPGTFYLTKVDKDYKRYYTIKDPDEKDLEDMKHFEWSGNLK
jgi:hypothetical protein